MADLKQSEILRDAFSTIEGQKALEVLRELSGYDSRVRLAENDRQQCFITGKIALFSEILEALRQPKQKRKSNARRNDYRSEF